jgi:hypothetical protein
LAGQGFGDIFLIQLKIKMFIKKIFPNSFQPCVGWLVALPLTKRFK